MVSTARRNLWRVAGWYDLDELISDGYLAYAICKKRYGDKVENRRHFMALFKLVYMSIIIDLANKRTAHVKAGVYDVAISRIARDGHEHDALELLAGGADDDVVLSAKLAGAPMEVKRLLEEMHAGYFTGRRCRKLKDGTRETTNDFYNRMLGCKGFDFEGVMREYLFA